MTSQTVERTVSPLGGMTYARFFPSDWLTGCRYLTLEEEGLYIRFCAYMYDTGSAPPDDERITSRLLGVHPLQYRKVMGSLIAKGKIIRAQGILINERVLEELDRYRTEQATRVKAAREREERRRRMEREIADAVAAQKASPGVNPPVNPRVNPGVNPRVISETTQRLPTQSTPKFSNEINESATTAVPQPNHDCGTNPEARSQKPERREEEVDLGTSVPASHSEALEAFQLYNDLAQKVGIPTATTLTPKRKRGILARLREHGGIEAWKAALTNIERSPFLCGKNDRGWTADLDFLLQAARFTKIVEGGYSNSNGMWRPAPRSAGQGVF
jgi:uncharacterized protein YdaU (DUF1376 family)